MKKTILAFSLCAGIILPATAQVEVVAVEETPLSSNALVVNKNGTPILPQAGDFAIGIDALPFLKFAGNAFNGSDNNGITFKGVNQTLYGKYFLRDNRAIRFQLSANYYSDAEKEFVQNDFEVINNPLNANATVADVLTTKHQELGLSVGYEFRRGRGRLQGFWGGGVTVWYSKESDDYAWGNPITEVNQTPSSGFGVMGRERPLKTNGGLTLGGGVQGFAGVEYFIAPQISLGGELGLAIGAYGTNQSETTIERYNPTSEKVENTTSRQGSTAGSGLSLETQTTGHLFLMFHF